MPEPAAPRRPMICVLGGAHMDLIASAPRLPGPGQSVLGDAFATAPGGKAANQAAQIARCGGRAALISRLGRDGFGDSLRAALAGAGVDLEHVAEDHETATGASTVFAAQGDYASIIAPGAAGRLSIADAGAAAPALDRADALVLQLETPVEASAAAAERVAAQGGQVVLNAAPEPPRWSALPEALRRVVTLLAVNRWEAARLLGDQSGEAVESDAPESQAAQNAAPETLAALLAERTGVGAVLLTLGPGGVLLRRGGATRAQPAFAADVLDAVGAGDACLGAFLVASLSGAGDADALRRGAAAGAIAVSRRGAFDAQPTAAEIAAFLQRMDQPRGGA